MGVVGVKTGTKTWSEGAKDTSAADLRTSNSLTPDQQAILGEKDLGAVLNKVVDPNWVDPSKKVRTTGNDKMDKDAFFKLMMAQMKSQDPTNPLKSHEMAAQLAQFSGLEQMTNMNQTLLEMKAAQKPSENFQSLNLLGKVVAGDSSKVARSPLDNEHEFRFNLPQDASEAEVKVRNSAGEFVRTYKLKNLKMGENKMTWNGENDNGQKTFPGDYQFIIEAKNTSGQKLNVKTQFEGVISGVTFSGEGPVLQVGNQSIKFRDVSKITDPSLKQNDQKTIQDLNQTGQITQTKSEKQSVAPMETNANQVLNNVGLSREMMEKISKETKADVKSETKPQASAADSKGEVKL